MRLSEGERAVLGFLAAGYRYKEIAEFRHVSFRTVKHQAYSAKSKLGARTITQAVVKYYVSRREYAA